MAADDSAVDSGFGARRAARGDDWFYGGLTRGTLKTPYNTSHTERITLVQ